MANELQQIKELWESAQRMSDHVSLHMIANKDFMDAVGKWVVFKLIDGSSNGVLYESKDDAVKDQKSRAKEFCYVKIPPDGMPVNHAATFLKVNRHPWVDTTAPENKINSYIYPRFSNLTPTQKQQIKIAAEQNARIHK